MADVDEVYLVEHDEGEVSDEVGSLVQHGAQYLCRHDQAGRLGLDGHVALAYEQTDAFVGTPQYEQRGEQRKTTVSSG